MRPRDASEVLKSVLLVATIGLVGVFYVWTVRSNGTPWKFGRPQKDYYNLLIDGFLAGQLAMKVDVPPALLQLADPYDPRTRPPGLALHDASFFRGKYYLYFGVAPVVTLMLPFRLLTGVALPEAVAVLAFVGLGFVTGAAVWLELRRRYFPASGDWLALGGVVVLGTANLGPVLLRRPQVWELPIAAGYAFVTLALWALLRSLHAGRRAGWLALAAVFLGLAVASRPLYVIVTPLVLLPAVARWRETGRWPWRETWSAVVPLAAIGLALAGYNQARFGSPLQFGQSYQLSLDYEARQPHFGWRYGPYNLRAYFFSGAGWTRYFPFVSPGPGAAAPKPSGYQVRGDVYGLAWHVPIVLLALLAPLALWRRAAEERRRLAAWLAVAGGVAVLTAGFMACFFSALPRYLVDFAPTLALLGLVGSLAVDRWWRERVGGRARALGAIVLALAGAYGIGFAVLFSFRVEGYFAERNPAEYRRVARWFNHLPAWVDRWSGRDYGPLEMSVRLSPAPGNTRQELLRVGEGLEADRLIARCRDDGRVEFGVDSAHGLPAFGEPVTLDFAAEHRLRVSMGSLLPPDTYPSWSGWREADVRAATLRLRIECDGRVVLDTSPWFAGEPGPVRTRRAVTRVTHAPMVPGPAADHAGVAGTGAVKLVVALPAAATGREPLLVLGHPGAADFVCIEYVNTDTVRFALDHWGSPLRQSEPVPLDRGRPHEITIAADSLAVGPEPDEHRHVWIGALVVAVDGRVAWRQPADFFNVPPEEIVVGRNVAGGTACAREFSGNLQVVGRVTPP